MFKKSNRMILCYLFRILFFFFFCFYCLALPFLEIDYQTKIIEEKWWFFFPFWKNKKQTLAEKSNEFSRKLNEQGRNIEIKWNVSLALWIYSIFLRLERPKLDRENRTITDEKKKNVWQKTGLHCCVGDFFIFLFSSVEK